MTNSIISPWNALDFYKEGQIIYGRDEEIHIITNSIKNNLQTIIYGRSGIGKTSLLNAGVFPKLRLENYFPVYIRLGMHSTSIASDTYADVIIDRVIKEAHRVNPEINKPYIRDEKVSNEIIASDDNSSLNKLYNFFDKTKFKDNNSLLIPVLIFDQFEEILNNNDTRFFAEEVIKDLYSLCDDNRIVRHQYLPYDNFRIVISIREDYLYTLEDVVDKYSLTEFRFNRHRICPLNVKNANNVILKTSGSYLEKGNEYNICSWIIEESKNKIGDIDTSMLSLICSVNFENAMKYADQTIKFVNLNKSNDYLYSYYLKQIDGIPSYTKKYLESKLITSDGRRDSLDCDEAIKSGRISREDIERLENKRIIRVISSGVNVRRFEFIHDKLTSVINKKKMSFRDMLFHIIRNAFVFSGTSNKEEWRVTSIFFWCIFIISYLASLYSFTFYTQYLLHLLYVAAFIIHFSTSVRRCHDIGESGFKIITKYRILGKEPSSVMAFDGDVSLVSWRKFLLHNSLTNIEFKALNIYFVYVLYILYILNIPLLYENIYISLARAMSTWLTSEICLSLLLSLSPTIEVQWAVVVIIIYALFLLILFARAYSIDYQFLCIVPLLNIYIWFKCLYKFEDEENVVLPKSDIIWYTYFNVILCIGLVWIVEHLLGH